MVRVLFMALPLGRRLGEPGVALALQFERQLGPAGLDDATGRQDMHDIGVVTMAESFSVERRKLLRMLGAKVILTPASEKGTGMLAKARELAEAHGWFLTRQFENEAGPDIHSATTAEEIVACFGALPHQRSPRGSADHAPENNV
jgi:cysteine synthase